MKRYIYAIAYSVVVGCLFATLLLVLPFLFIDTLQGRASVVDVFQTLLLIPFIAGAVGFMLAGLPVVLIGFTIALLERLPTLLFLIMTLIIAVALEFGYCYLLHVKENFLPTILTVTAITTLCISLFWRFWLSLRIE